MDRLDVMRLFVRVTETGSFSRAARSTGIAQSTASKQIALLEERLGAQLLRRTSRGISLTEAGQDYYESAVRLLGEVDAAESRIGRGQGAPSGVVRIATSSSFVPACILPRLPEFFARFPDISIDFDVSDGYVNLIEERIDVAIRMGALTDSTLVARRIGAVEAMTVAAPSYLAAFGEPSTPADLEDHACITSVVRGSAWLWRFEGPAGQFSITPKGWIRTNDSEHMRAAALAGLGVCYCPSWMFKADIASGTMKRVLESHTTPVHPINVVWPAGRLVPNKVKVFIEFISRICAEEPTLRPR